MLGSDIVGGQNALAARLAEGYDAILTEYEEVIAPALQALNNLGALTGPHKVRFGARTLATWS